MPIPPLPVDEVTAIFPPTERSILKNRILSWFKHKVKKQIENIENAGDKEDRDNTPQTAPSIPPIEPLDETKK